MSNGATYQKFTIHCDIHQVLTERTSIVNRHLTSRVLAAALVGVLFGSYMHHDYARWGQRGLQQFIAHQTLRFELYMASPKPAVLTIVGATIFVFGVAGFYESIALLFSTVFKKMRIWSDDRSSFTGDVES
jgi:hypothetical protein